MQTVKADRKKRVVIPDAEPEQVFSYEKVNGSFTLTPVVKAGQLGPAKVKVEKRGGFSVGVLDRPINEQALAEALAEFP